MQDCNSSHTISTHDLDGSTSKKCQNGNKMPHDYLRQINNGKFLLK